MSVWDCFWARARRRASLALAVSVSLLLVVEKRDVVD